MSYRRLRKLGLSWEAQRALEESRRQQFDPAWLEPTAQEAEMLRQSPGLAQEGEPDTGEYGIRVAPEPEMGAARVRQPNWGLAYMMTPLLRASEGMQRSVGTEVPQLASLSQQANQLVRQMMQARALGQSTSSYPARIDAVLQQLEQYATQNTDENPYAADAAIEGVSAMRTALSGIESGAARRGPGEAYTLNPTTPIGPGMTVTPEMGGSRMGAGEAFMSTPESGGAPTVPIGPGMTVGPGGGERGMARPPAQMMVSEPGSPAANPTMTPTGLPEETITPTERGMARTPPKPTGPPGTKYYGGATPGAEYMGEARNRAEQSRLRAEQAAGNARLIAQQAREAEQRRQQAARGGRVASLKHDRMLKRAYAFKKLISAVKK